MFRARNDAQSFDKFTERARAVLSYSQEEAQRLNHNYIGAEHLLLGLLRATDGIAARALNSLGVELEEARRSVESIVGRGSRVVLGAVGMTPRAKKVIELATVEARKLNHHYIGTEHLLLGIVREGEGIATGVLERLGVTLVAVREQVMRVLSSRPRAGEEAAEVPAATREPGGVKSNVVTCRLDDASLNALDALVEAGVRSTRSDAAAWLIAAGIESHRALFERVNATVGEIRRLRNEARTLAEQVIAEGQESEPEQKPPEEPETPGQPAPEG